MLWDGALRKRWMLSKLIPYTEMELPQGICCEWWLYPAQVGGVQRSITAAHKVVKSIPSSGGKEG